MRTTDQAHRGAIAHLPPGWTFPRDPLSAMGRTLRPLGQAAVAFEQAAEAQLEEATPSTSGPMLDDYERVLGPDPCLAARPVSLEERRLSAHQRWTATGGASRAHLVELAAKLGYAITIEEFRPARAAANGGGGAASRLRAGWPCYPRGVIWTWRVHAPPTRVVQFKAGRGKAGQRLRSQGVPWLECVLRRAAPVHTTLIFAYGAPLPVTDDLGFAVTNDTGQVVFA